MLKKILLKCNFEKNLKYTEFIYSWLRITSWEGRKSILCSQHLALLSSEKWWFSFGCRISHLLYRRSSNRLQMISLKRLKIELIAWEKAILTLFPVKENIGRGTGIGRLIPTWPHSTLCLKYLAAFPDLVKIAVPFPQGLLKRKIKGILETMYFLAVFFLIYLLISLTASSNVSTCITHKAGPKISSL